MNEPSETPRTDSALVLNCAGIIIDLIPTGHIVSADFARTLERELAATNALISKMHRMVDIAEKANDAASEQEVAASADFNEAMAYQRIDNLEAELAAKSVECERLRAVLDALPDRLAQCLENLWTALGWNCEVLSVAQKTVCDEIGEALKPE